VHKFSDNDYLLVINAGTREKDFQWVKSNVQRFDCHANDYSDFYTQLAIQGPKAAETLAKLTKVDLSTIKGYCFKWGTVCGLPNTLIARTGYTGEDGFEIYVPSDVATSERVWNEVLEAGQEFGILACGLGARNTLRLEAGMSLYDHEISDTINVFEAGLDRFLKLEKGTFVGSEALKLIQAEGGPAKKLVGLEMIERGIARDGYPVLNTDGKKIGVVTSGSPSPFLKKNIAMAYVPRELAVVDGEVAVEVRGNAVKARIIPTPFYRRPKKTA
jgi:aminomethyltransferase